MARESATLRSDDDLIDNVTRLLAAGHCAEPPRTLKARWSSPPDTSASPVTRRPRVRGRPKRPAGTASNSWSRAVAGLGDDLLAEITQHLAAQGVRLREGTIVDATIIAAPASTKNRAQQRDPEMHQAKKGNQWYFGMKAHIGVDAHTGLVHSLATTAASVADVTQVSQLLHGSETRVWGDAGYQGVDRRPEHQGRAMDWQVALRAGQRRRLPPGSAAAQVERRKAAIRAKVEHPFLYVKRHFGYATVRYRGLAKNRNRLCLLFGLANLLLAEHSATA